MKRLTSLIFTLAFAITVWPAAADLAAKEICSDDVRLTKIELRSEVIECCDQKSRFKAAATAAKDLVYKISDLCRENGCEESAIARICINYEAVSDARCVAVVTAWYACCCCIIDNPSVVDCEIDRSVCADNSTESISIAGRYRCCNIDSRWNAIYDTMKKAYIQADEKCSLLDCLGSLFIRGFEVNFSPTNIDGVCAVKSTIYYSCCCVCR